jgi:hypothetical protein
VAISVDRHWPSVVIAILPTYAVKVHIGLEKDFVYDAYKRNYSQKVFM